MEDVCHSHGNPIISRRKAMIDIDTPLAENEITTNEQ